MKTLATIFLLFCATIIQAQETLVPRQLKAQTARSGVRRVAPSVLLPYHRLAWSDFPINEKALLPYAQTQPFENAMAISCFADPEFEYDCIAKNGQFVAFVTNWRVKSGMDRNKSGRLKGLTRAEIESMLPHEQGHFDINELHSRKLANTPLAKLPVGKGETCPEAENSLRTQINTLSDDVAKDISFEQAVYEATTSYGMNQAAQKKATAELGERLRRAGITYEVAER